VLRRCLAVVFKALCRIAGFDRRQQSACVNNSAMANVKDLVDNEPVGAELPPVLDNPLAMAFIDRVLRDLNGEMAGALDWDAEVPPFVMAPYIPDVDVPWCNPFAVNNDLDLDLRALSLPATTPDLNSMASISHFLFFAGSVPFKAQLSS